MLTTSVASIVAAGAGWSRLREKVLFPAARNTSFGNSDVLPLIFANCLFHHDPALVAMFLLGWSPLCAPRCCARAHQRRSAAVAATASLARRPRRLRA